MSGSSYRPLSHASLQPEVLFTSVLCIGSMPAIASAIRLDWPQFQTSLYNQLVSERTQARKSAMAGNLLKSSWLWRGYNKEICRWCRTTTGVDNSGGVPHSAFLASQLLEYAGDGIPGEQQGLRHQRAQAVDPDGVNGYFIALQGGSS